MFKISYPYQDAGDKEDEINQKLTNIIRKRVLLRAVELLPEEKQEEFNKILSEENQEKTDQFLGENIPNIQEVIDEEIENLKRELKEEKNEDM